MKTEKDLIKPPVLCCKDLFGLPAPLATQKIMFAPWMGVAVDRHVWNSQTILRASACLAAAFYFL